MKLIDWLEGISHTAYMVNEEGQIWSTESEQFLKPQDNKGYHEVDLKWEGTRVKKKVHRLVCQAFYGPPPNDKSEVDHLDMNRHNNSKENLEWVTKSENIQRRNASGSDSGGKAKKVVALTEDMITAKLFLSHTSAIRYLDTAPSTFYKALTDHIKIKGYRILTVDNQEVLGNERNQNRPQQGHDESAGPATESGEEAEQEPAEETRSTEAQRVLAKWGRA